MNSCHCNYCGTVLPQVSEATLTSLWHEQLRISGRAESNCQHCGATLRERQLKFYFDEVKLLHGRSRMRILHFNPEPRFLNYLANLNPEIHILAMAQAVDLRYETVNIEDLPYSDGAFDLIIANGQLETVLSVTKTLEELNRVLKADGLLVLQTSFSHVLESTWEDAGLDNEMLRASAYGNGSHRRLFGCDIVDLLSRQLNNNVIKFLQLSSSNLHDLDVDDPFMLFRKKLSVGARSFSPLEPFLNKEVAVSILCLTYNHAAFIDKTLHSFIEQKTNFRFEIVIGEDCSTDNTLNLINTWANKYPHIIKLISGGPNIGARLNWYRTYAACTGRYIALCEGDDRWTDPLKLQKQFDFMESHSDCAMTYGNVQAHKEGLIQYNYTGGLKVDLSAEALQKAPAINTMTVMFRNVLGSMPPEMLACGAGDMFIWSILGRHGYGHYMQNILPAIYNIHSGGVHSLTGIANQHLMRLKTYYAAFQYYVRIGIPDLSEYFLQGVVNDAVHISNISTPEQVQVLLGSLASDLSRLMQHVTTFDTSALSIIINQVLAQLKSSNDHKSQNNA
jgi:glycosyltransferase involved in cell wall biosynthesis/SAM-dependent methyltransferase